jgi:CRP/FNR family cyclic AMP-dependent transcriptional regulator
MPTPPEVLRRLPLFADLEPRQLERVAAAAICKEHPANRIVFREGDAVDAFYLVAEGSVAVFRDVKGKPLQLLARLEKGEFFGEMGLLNRSRRLATARTTLPTTLIRIEKADLLAILADNPNLELRVRAEVIRRHGMNVSALLGLAGQRDVRIRLGVPALLGWDGDGGVPLPVRLENLSLHGLALAGAPASWKPGEPVRFTLGRDGEAAILAVSGTVSWRQAETAGIAFAPETGGDGGPIYEALREFLR